MEVEDNNEDNEDNNNKRNEIKDNLIVRFEVTPEDITLNSNINENKFKNTSSSSSSFSIFKSKVKKESKENSHNCVICHENEGIFQPDSCNCSYSYCRKCAMKYGTGGRCAVCGNYYGSIRRSTH